MAEAEQKPGVGCLFIGVIALLVIGPVSTCGVVMYTRMRSGARGKPAVATAPEGQAGVMDPRVQKDGARICAAYARLAPTLAGDGVAEESAVWKQLGTATAPDDPWGRPYEWQPWNRSIRSYGPDKLRGTPDDLIVRCEG